MRKKEDRWRWGKVLDRKGIGRKDKKGDGEKEESS